MLYRSESGTTIVVPYERMDSRFGSGKIAMYVAMLNQ